MNSRITIEQVSYRTFVVLYDNEVSLGQIVRRNCDFSFYPVDIDGISYYTMSLIVDKIRELKQDFPSHLDFQVDEILQAHSKPKKKIIYYRKNPSPIRRGEHISLVNILRQTIIDTGLTPKSAESYTDYSVEELKRHIKLVKKAAIFANYKTNNKL